jgi:hypothetical protein
MATTNIELDIENITGIGSGNADAQFIKTAQKFVVSSIPKELMLWAGTTTSVASHGGDSSPTAITIPQPTDNIIDVQRNGFSAEQVPESMQGFIASTASLHLATETYPKYYMQAGNKIIVKPDPSDSETALVNYVDFLKVDDDCDLRSAVIYHACASEFTKLGSGKITDWTDLAAPVAPSSPDFGSNLTIDAVAPVAPSVSAASVTITGTAPTYSSPVISLGATPTISDLSISVSLPVTPSLTSVTFTSIDSDIDASSPLFVTATVSAGDIYTGSSPTYIKPLLSSQTAFADYWTLTDFGDSDPGSTVVTAVPPDSIADTISDFSLDSEFDDAMLNAKNLIDNNAPASGDDAFDWISEEDPEMVSATLQTASQEIQRANAALQKSLQTFNSDLQKFQASGTGKFSAEVSAYQADVNKEVQEYTQKLSRYQLELNTVYTAWSKTESDNLSKYQSDIQNELNSFNEKNAAFQAQIQESMQEIQVANQVNIARAQADLQVSTRNEDRSQERQLQNGINDMQAIINDNNRIISIFQAEISRYQAEVSTEVQEYQQNLEGDLRVWTSERQTDLQKYNSDIQNALNSFNKENIEYQALLQKDVTDAQLSDADESKKIQKYSAEVNAYQQDVSKEVQDFSNTLNKELQEYQSKVSLYNSNLQKYQAEAAEKTQKISSSSQNAAYYSKEAEKYYGWANLEIKSYIQNNSKIINQTIAAQAQVQQQQQYRR